MGHDGADRGQVGGKEDVQLVKLLPKPAGQLALHVESAGKDQGMACQILRRDGVAFCQGGIRVHNGDPFLPLVQADIVVLFHIDRLEQQPRVGQAPVHAVLDVVGGGGV